MAKDRASEEALSNLHAEFAKVLTDGITNGMEVANEEGMLVRVPATPAYLNVVRQFLKDNKIEAIPAKDSPLGVLAGSLPSFEEEID